MLQRLAQCGQYAGEGCLNAVCMRAGVGACVCQRATETVCLLLDFFPDLHYETPKGGQGCMMAPSPPVWNLRTVF